MPPINRSPRLHNQVPAWYVIQNDATAVPCIKLFGSIGLSKEDNFYWGDEGGAGTFREFCKELDLIGNVPELRVEIHSYGGSVVVGKAIHDKLVEHPSHKTAIIYGICASAATYAALACHHVMIPANSFFLIHNSSGYCMGGAAEMLRQADVLTACDVSIADMYSARTGKPESEIRAIMDKDTWMTGKQAVELGLADEMIEAVKVDPSQRAAADNFSNSALNSMPQEARRWFDSRSITNLKPPTTPPVNVMTEAELTAAKLKLEADRIAFENLKKQGEADAKTLLENAKAEALKITNAAKPPVPPPEKTDLEKAIENAVKPLLEKVENFEKRLDQNVTLSNVGGAPPVTGVKPPEVPGEVKPPTNEAELEAAIQNAKTQGEKLRILNAYDASKRAR